MELKEKIWHKNMDVSFSSVSHCSLQDFRNVCLKKKRDAQEKNKIWPSEGTIFLRESHK